VDKIIKLAAVHSYDEMLYAAANPYNEEFCDAAPQKLKEDYIEKTLAFLHTAGKEKADLVCTHEDFNGVGLYAGWLDYPHLFSSLAEEIPGPTSHRLGEVARIYGMHIAANYYEKDGKDFYNTTVLFGRTGEIIGKYRKVHLPAREKWRVTAGKEISVFDTDIGRIGFAVCYDSQFTEHCRAMALNGADIIIHQTQGWGVDSNDLGEALVRTRAAENSIYLIVAKNIQKGDGGKSCIIDNYGRILAEASGEEERVITSEVVPDYDLVDESHFNSFFSGIASIRARRTLERAPWAYSVIAEPLPPLYERYRDFEKQNTQEKTAEAHERWKVYSEAIRNKRPVARKYHW